MRRHRRVVEDASTQRGRDQSDRAGEFHFGDQTDYVTFTAGLLKRSSLKYSAVANAGGMSPSTASNLASGKTKYPRFSTIAGILGALGYETVIRAGGNKKR
jgi:DNA-binding Xre family transcriptional regulator